MSRGKLNDNTHKTKRKHSGILALKPWLISIPAVAVHRPVVPAVRKIMKMRRKGLQRLKHEEKRKAVC